MISVYQINKKLFTLCSNRNKIILNSAVLQEGETINYKWVTKEELLGIFWNRKRRESCNLYRI